MNGSVCWLSRIAVLAVWLLWGIASAWGQEQVSVRLEFVPNGYHGPFYMALGKGYYREEGLDVQIRRGFGSDDTIKRLMAGGDTIGFADFYTVVKGIADGARVRAIGAGFGDTIGCIVAISKSGIRKPADLEGRSLGTPPGGAFTLQLPTVLRAAGVDPAKVKIVTMDIVLKSSALVAGKVDAITGAFVSEPPAFRSKGLDVVVFDYRDFINIMGTGIISNQNLIQQQPELIRKFLRATYRGARDFSHDPASVAPIMVRIHPEGDAGSYAGQAVSSVSLWASPVAKRTGFGWMDEVKMRNTVEQSTKDFKLTRRVEAAEFYTNEFVPVPAIRP
ncbi:MAG: ABC transporter substrate-binding protein [Deltaproteobacteria bacterium]|nr:ABC transporter substrate-binding protein [Deltaproteobacteria bacterium]